MAVEQGDDGEWQVNEDELGDVAGHGTACAGIVRSLAPLCGLWSVRVLGPSAKGGGAALLSGLRWAVEQGCEVVNLSLSSSKRETAALLHEVADDAYFGSTVLVAAAHNLDIRSLSVALLLSDLGGEPRRRRSLRVPLQP